MSKLDWMMIAQAAERLGFVAAGDEVLNIARDNGINIMVSPDQKIKPTLNVGGKDVYILVRPHLLERNPRVIVSVFGNTFPVKNLLKSEGYRFEGRAWIKEFRVQVGASDEDIIQAVLSAVEEAMFVKALLTQRSP